MKPKTNKQTNYLAPASVFLASSPLNLVGRTTHHEQEQHTAQNNNNNRITNDQVCTNRSPLESIAEVSEMTTTQQKQPSSALNNNSIPSSNNNNHQQQHNNKHNETLETDRRRRLSPLNTRSASSPSKLEMPSPQQHDLTRSPTPGSEANASIDLCCETPASASIDILDHNIKPIDKIASVLHHKQTDSKEEKKEWPIVEEELSENIGHEKSGAQKEASTTTTTNDNSTPIIQTSMTPDSLESEEAAAIRIQSAFRGYRTRKNSPYRTRSPQNSAAGQQKRNALTRQQEATVLHENDAEDVMDDQERNMEPIEQLEATQLAQSEGRRESRPRQREQSPIIKGAPSVDEFTTTEVTIREANKPTTTTTNETDDTSRVNSNRATVGSGLDPSLSLDLTTGSLSEPINNNTSYEIGLSAALESAQTNMTTNQDVALQAPPRNLSGKESDASIELDTDSSVLGAALSLNSEDANELPTHQQQASIASIPPNLEPIDEMDKSMGFSLTDELESEARKLVEELNLNQNQEDGGEDKKTQQRQQKNEEELYEATHQLESVLEDATAAGIVESLLHDEEEQRDIELESDDIERRDPRGYVSEDRQSKSPQIKTEEPKLTDDNNDGGELVMDDDNGQIESSTTGTGLTVDSPPIEDGASSPAFNSSANVSSDDDNSDQENRNENNQQQKQQQNRSPPGSKNKKRNNRNKKKGRK